MPRNMPSALTAEKNKINQTGVWVWLMTLTTPDGATTVRLVNNTQDVTLGGHVYGAFNFSIDPIESNTQGELAALTVTVTNIGLSLQEVIRANNGLRGATLTLVQVNTNLLDQDYSGDTVAFEVLHCQNLYWDIVLHLGVPSTLNQRVPPDRFLALQCRHRFRGPSGAYTARCGYEGRTVTAVTLTAGAPVQVTATGHGFVTGERLRVYGGTELSPALDGDYTITTVDANNFTLDGTNGSDYTGVYTAAGRAGYAKCDRMFTVCRGYGRSARYGGNATQRGDALRLAF